MSLLMFKLISNLGYTEDKIYLNDRNGTTCHNHEKIEDFRKYNCKIAPI